MLFGSFATAFIKAVITLNGFARKVKSNTTNSNGRFVLVQDVINGEGFLE